MKLLRTFSPILVVTLLACLLAGTRLAAQPATLPDVEMSLRKLNETGTLLMIAAHPDDERTNVLAYFARGRYMRTAYLSITRGEGGQNLIGADQGEVGLVEVVGLLVGAIDNGEIDAGARGSVGGERALE